MKAKLFSFVALMTLLVLSLGVASAAVSLNAPQALTVSGNPGNTVQIDLSSVTLSNDVANYTGLTWSVTPLSASWSLPSLPASSDTSNSQTLSGFAVFSIPSNSTPSSAAYNLNVFNGSLKLASQLITVTVNPVHTISVAKTAEVSRIQNGTFTITNTGNEQFTLTYSVSGELALNVYDGSSLITPQSLIVLAKGATKTLTVAATNFGSLKVGQGTSTITFIDSVALTSKGSVDFSSIQSFCKSGPVGGNLSITRFKVTSSGSDDLTWKPLNTVTVEVRVKNTNNAVVNNVNLDLGLYDSSGNNVVGDLTFSNSDEDQISVGDLGKGDDQTETFEFQVPSDFETGDYKLAVKAYDSDAESKECVDNSDGTFFKTVSVEKETSRSKTITFDNPRLSSDTATCGDLETLRINLVNVGDINEDRVRVALTSKELGLSATQEITSGLDTGDSKAISFDFQIPQGLADKTYTLALSTSFDYRNGQYNKNSDSTFEVPIKVFGCSAAASQNVASIIAPGVSANAGEAVSVKATVTNAGKSAVTFVINARGYDSWASLDSISQRTLLLNAGESKDITVSLVANKGVAGAKTLTVEAISGDNSVTKDVQVTFPAASNSSFDLGGNWLIWVIGAVNIILIVIIIIVAVRVSRR